MTEVEFLLDGTKIIIQCNENEKLEEIIKKLCLLIKKNKEEMIFLYDGNTINDQLTFNETANIEDKQRKKLSIIITYNKTINNINLKKSKYIRCPRCNEIAKIEIKDYKIKLYGCKNNHIIENLSFSDFNQSQLIDESKIICDICKNNNKGNTLNNIFYICNECNKNMCPLCKVTHDNKHTIIDYDQKYYKCPKHNENYTHYCNDCKINICIICEKEHNNHNIISLGNIIPDKNILEENKNNLRNTINKFNNEIKDIINKLNNIINNIAEYYNIYNDIIKEIENINYEILQNINYMNKYNIINELNNIIKDNNIYYKFNNIINIYYKIYLNKNYMSNEELKLYYKNKLKEINNSLHIKVAHDNGDRYEGKYKNGLREGKGIYYFSTGDRYEGEYKNDKREGKGIYYYKNGNIYKGEWKNNAFEGRGIYYYHTGNRYEGEYKNSLKEGKGIYYFNNGNRYEGEFKNNKMEGKGIYYYNNGNREMGNYLNGNKIGMHVTLTINGEVLTNIYN